MNAFEPITLSRMSQLAAEANACAWSRIGTFIAFASATADSHEVASSTQSRGFTAAADAAEEGDGGRDVGGLVFGGGAPPPPFASARPPSPASAQSTSVPRRAGAGRMGGLRRAPTRRGEACA